MATTSHPLFPSGSTVNFYSQGEKKQLLLKKKENIKVSFTDDYLTVYLLADTNMVKTNSIKLDVCVCPAAVFTHLLRVGCS